MCNQCVEECVYVCLPNSRQGLRRWVFYTQQFRAPRWTRYDSTENNTTTPSLTWAARTDPYCRRTLLPTSTKHSSNQGSRGQTPYFARRKAALAAISPKTGRKAQNQNCNTNAPLENFVFWPRQRPRINANDKDMTQNAT